MRYESIFLVSDLDGTLTTPDRRVHPDNTAALRKFLAGGGRFTLATGREWNALDDGRTRLILQNPVVLVNGARIYDPLQAADLETSWLPADSVAWIHHIAAEFPDLGILAITTGDPVIMVEPPHRDRDLPPIYKQFPRRSLADMPPRILKILLVGQLNRLNTARARLHRLAGEGLTIVNSSETLLDITAAGVSKGTALHRLFTQYRPEMTAGRYIVAVGDQENDLTMFALADLAFAMGQAERPVKEAADFVLPDCTKPMLPNLLRIIDELDENDFRR